MGFDSSKASKQSTTLEKPASTRSAINEGNASNSKTHPSTDPRKLADASPNPDITQKLARFISLKTSKPFTPREAALVNEILTGKYSKEALKMVDDALKEAGSVESTFLTVMRLY